MRDLHALYWLESASHSERFFIISVSNFCKGMSAQQIDVVVCHPLDHCFYHDYLTPFFPLFSGVIVSVCCLCGEWCSVGSVVHFPNAASHHHLCLLFCLAPFMRSFLAFLLHQWRTEGPFDEASSKTDAGRPRRASWHGSQRLGSAAPTARQVSWWGGGQ